MKPTCRVDKIQRQGLLDLINELPLHNATALELGSYKGESAEMFLDSGKITSIVCVDRFEPARMNMTEDYEKAFDERMKRFGSSVVKLKYSTDEALEKLKGWRFDFIYIDAGHRYQRVISDIGIALALLKLDGIVAGHDYLLDNGLGIADVKKAVDVFFGRPDKIYVDSSWLMKTWRPKG